MLGTRALLNQFVLFLAVAVTVLVLMGPRLKTVNQLTSAPKLPEDLDAYFAESESKVPRLRPGTEKKIIWADKSHRKTQYSVVYLHGFSASRGELSPVVENVASTLSANAFFTRFRGHGQTGDELGKATPEQWLEDGVEALEVGKRIGEKVIVVGMSTGGLVATWLAVLKQPMDSLILVSPNFALKDRRTQILFWPWGIQLGKLIAGSERSWEPKNPLQDQFWTHRYPLESLMPLLTLSRDLRKQDLSAIETPVLTLYTPHDERIDVELVQEYFKRFGSPKKEIHSIEQGREHVLAGNAVSPENNKLVEEKILAFLADSTHFAGRANASSDPR